MNREQAAELIQKYRDFPRTDVFSIGARNYPLFHIMECFAKGWRIEDITACGWHSSDLEDIDFNLYGSQLKRGINHIWRFAARNPKLSCASTQVVLVHEDLYCRYVGHCNPLKIETTTWRIIPIEKFRQTKTYDDWASGLNPKAGNIGGSNLYSLEIDNDIVDIKGKWNDNIPWHYLQQTMDWKEYKDTIDWNAEEEKRDPLFNSLRARYERARQENPAANRLAE